ncbi:hypothetical protein CSOJ01_09210 [Colletotrichum sojae]|uniref:Uncharacterized protein n=1 Tax=Colletotrichum sojae TaxID=2175907 RepID=A0A8H6J3K1_9PEZI|nr:hypothetical protein CSOJ01_09210 [Colletotrichum sojae]
MTASIIWKQQATQVEKLVLKRRKGGEGQAMRTPPMIRRFGMFLPGGSPAHVDAEGVFWDGVNSVVRLNPGSKDTRTKISMLPLPAEVGGMGRLRNKPSEVRRGAVCEAINPVANTAFMQEGVTHRTRNMPKVQESTAVLVIRSVATGAADSQEE